MKHTLSIVIVAITLISTTYSCKKDKDDTPLPEQKPAEFDIYNFIDNVMDTIYLWNDKIPQTVATAKEDPVNYFNSYLTYSIDRYSFMTYAAEFNAEVAEGEGGSFGIDLSANSSGNIVVSYVYPGSDAESKGLTRGCIINRIDDQELTYEKLVFLLSGNIGDIAKVEYIKNDTIHTAKLTCSSITKPPLLAEATYNLNGEKVGYFSFENFFEYSLSAINGIFEKFKSEGISDLIIDLRYNNGGMLEIEQDIAELILPAHYSGDVLHRLTHNKLLSSYDTSYVLNIDPEQTLALDRVFIITGANSASASESLIKGLEPYCEVITVGQQTYGKPVGMYSIYYNEWILLPIAFKIVNANDEGNYYNGIVPDYQVNDDFNYDLGDENEMSIKSILQYIHTGSFGEIIASVKSSTNNYAITQMKAAKKDIFYSNRFTKH